MTHSSTARHAAPSPWSAWLLVVLVFLSGLVFLAIAWLTENAAPPDASIITRTKLRSVGPPIATGLWILYVPAGIQLLQAVCLGIVQLGKLSDRGSWLWAIGTTAFGVLMLSKLAPEALG